MTEKTTLRFFELDRFEAIAGFNYSAYSFGPYEETELEQLDRYRNLGVQGGLAYTLPLFDEYIEVMASVMGGWSGAIKYERLKGPPTAPTLIKYRELQGPSLAIDARIFWRPYAITDQWGIGPRVGWEGTFLGENARLYVNGYNEALDPDPNRVDLLTGGISILYQHYQPDYDPSIKILADISVGQANFQTLWFDGKYEQLGDLAFQGRVLLTVPFSVFKPNTDLDEIPEPREPEPARPMPPEILPTPVPKPPEPPPVEPPEPPEPPLDKDLILKSAKVFLSDLPPEGSYYLWVKSNKAASLVVQVGSRKIPLTLDPGGNDRLLLAKSAVSALAGYVEIRLPVKIVEINGESVNPPKIVNGSPIVIPAKEKLPAIQHPNLEAIKAGDIAEVLFCNIGKEFVRQEAKANIYAYIIHAKVDGMMYIPNLNKTIEELFSYGPQFANLSHVSAYQRLPDGIVRYEYRNKNDSSGTGYSLRLKEISRQKHEYGTVFGISWENAAESDQPALSVDDPLLLFAVNNGSLTLTPTEYKDIYQVTLEIQQETDTKKGAGSHTHYTNVGESVETSLKENLKRELLNYFKNLALKTITIN